MTTNQRLLVVALVLAYAGFMGQVLRLAGPTLYRAPLLAVLSMAGAWVLVRLDQRGQLPR